jgi:hypothetical protein
MPTSVTLAITRVPEPFETVQVCPAGWAFTVTAKLPSSGIGLAKVNAPFALTDNVSPPLSFNVSRVPVVKPDTVPLTEKVVGPGGGEFPGAVGEFPGVAGEVPGAAP